MADETKKDGVDDIEPKKDPKGGGAKRLGDLQNRPVFKQPEGPGGGSQDS